MAGPVDVARFVTMTDALFRMLSDVDLPPAVAEAVRALRQERGAWPEWDVGSCISATLPVILQPAERRQIDVFVPTDRRFLLSRIEVEIERGSVGLALFDGEKYMARSADQRLDGCYKLVEPREGFRFEIQNKVANELDVHRLRPDAQAIVKAVHAIGFILT